MAVDALAAGAAAVEHGGGRSGTPVEEVHHAARPTAESPLAPTLPVAAEREQGARRRRAGPRAMSSMCGLRPRFSWITRTVGRPRSARRAAGRRRARRPHEVAAAGAVALRRRELDRRGDDARVGRRDLLGGGEVRAQRLEEPRPQSRAPWTAGAFVEVRGGEPSVRWRCALGWKRPAVLPHGSAVARAGGCGRWSLC